MAASSTLFPDPLLTALLRRVQPALQRRLPPTPAGLPLLGNLLELQTDVLELMARSRREQGDMFRLRLGPFDFVVVHRPETIREILLERAAEFGRSPSYAGIRMVLGEGLLTTDDESYWRRQRKLVNPAFHYAQLRALAETMVECACELRERWDTHLRLHAHEPIDFHAQCVALTFRIVGRTLFSTELSTSEGEVGPALNTLVEHANFVTTNLFLAPPPWVPTERNRTFAAAQKVVDTLVYDMIHARRRAGEFGNDVLGMLMATSAEDDARPMSIEDLRNEVTTMVMAGHETTAQALSWLFMLLSQHPQVERRMAAEVREVCGDRAPSIDDLDGLKYTGWAISEALRLYPPAWMFERAARHDTQLEGYEIPSGTIVAVVPWTLHRHPSYWQNPEGFDPDRFDPARSNERPRYAYLPFGGGPRQCIGINFARYELKLVAATLLQHHALELVPNQDLRPNAEITLRPRAGMKMRLRPR